MAITLSDGTTTINLSADLLWSDEHTWHPVEQSVVRGITGATIIQSQLRITGRPITLESEEGNSAGMRKPVVDQLDTWAAVPEKELVLTLRGVAHNVIVRHQEGGFECRPWVHYSDVVDEDLFICTLRFMEI